MPLIDPATAAQKWVRNTQAAGPSVAAGVAAVTESPTAKAALQADKYVAGVQAAVQSGKWQARLNAVTLQQWQQAMTTKGIPRISQGVASAQPKFQAFATQFFPYLQQGLAQLKSMPTTDLQSRIQRAVFIMNYNAQFSLKH